MATESTLKQILDSLNAAVLMVDRHLTVHLLNASAEVLLGVSSTQIIETPLTRYVQESDQVAVTLQDAISEAHTFTKRGAHWHLYNGQKLTVDYSVTPMQENGMFILEIQQIDRLLRISRDEALLSSQETTRNLVRSMAHEIKNPLGGIRGAAQLLSRELSSQTLEEYTQVIIDEADRLRNLVDRMLGPRHLPHCSPINIHEVLERVAAIINAESEGKITIQRDYDPSIPDLPGDKEQLIQAVLNITRNALQALQESEKSEPGVIVLQTRIQRQFTIGRRHHSLVGCITIIDNGPGIPKDLIQDIFYPMISGRAEGTGLGLAISQQLIHRHNGIIECDSSSGRTAFSIYLPLEQQYAQGKQSLDY